MFKCFIALFIISLAAIGSNLEQKCQELGAKYPKSSRQELSKKLYEEAFIHSMNGQWQRAEDASRCSLMLLNGESKWAIEASDLL